MTREEAKEHADGMRPGHDIVDDGLAEAFRWALAENDALRRAASDAQDLFAVCDGERLVLRAQVDALRFELGCRRSQVANLVSRIVGKPGDDTSEAVGEASRTALVLRKQVDALTAGVADLRTRAIPADYSTRVIVDLRERGLACVLYRHDAAPDARWTTSLWAQSPSDKHHPTLADALDAAGKVTP
jgi:hypothetical protein